MPDAEELDEELAEGDEDIDLEEIEDMSIEDLAEEAGGDDDMGWDSGVDQYYPIDVQISNLTANNWNPNEMDSEEFDRLVENIEDDGYLAPIQAVPVDEEGDNIQVDEDEVPEDGDELAEFLREEMHHARIVGGEHRWSAAKVVGMETIPTILVPNKDEEWEKMATVRMNAISGSIDPVQFAELVEEQRERFEDDRELKRQLGYAGDETLFDEVIEDIKESVPDDVKEELEEEEDEIETIDDLSEVLNRIFRESGDDLDHHFIAFQYGGEESVMYQVDDRAYAKVEDLNERIKDVGGSATVFWEHFLDGAPIDEAIEACEGKADVSEDEEDEPEEEEVEDESDDGEE